MTDAYTNVTMYQIITTWSYLWCLAILFLEIKDTFVTYIYRYWLIFVLLLLLIEYVSSSEQFFSYIHDENKKTST